MGIGRNIVGAEFANSTFEENGNRDIETERKEIRDRGRKVEKKSEEWRLGEGR